MDVTIVSRENIKPSSLSTQHLNPHKLSFFDQIVPLTYATCVLFYPNTTLITRHKSISKTLTNLKISLSDTLNLYYPFSGRLKHDLIHVHDFEAGVPFLEARVNSRMSDYFRNNFHNSEVLNKLFPYPPFCKETNEPTPIPLLAFQANVFSCGGIALGGSLCHKIGDGASMFYFSRTWSALSRGSPNELIKPNFSDIATLFPPIPDLPQKYSALFDRLLFRKGNYVTRRFIFAAEAVETLREKASINGEDKPTRNEAVSCFIWKHVTEACLAVSGSRKGISLYNSLVNIRGKLKITNPIGNLLLWISAMVENSTDEGESEKMELENLVKLVKQGREVYESEIRIVMEDCYKEGLGSERLLRILEKSVSVLEELDSEPCDLRYTICKDFFNEIDFGLGKPYKVGFIGKVGPEFCNSVFMVDSQCGMGIEATINLEEKQMAVLECDVKFLAFASTDSRISSL